MKKKAKRPIKKADLKKPAILDAADFEETALACQKAVPCWDGNFPQVTSFS